MQQRLVLLLLLMFVTFQGFLCPSTTKIQTKYFADVEVEMSLEDRPSESTFETLIFNSTAQNPLPFLALHNESDFLDQFSFYESLTQKVPSPPPSHA